MNRIELPRQSGAYRWYYFDVTAGDFTAVFIFMVGSIFSARYSAGLKRGALPTAHSAVNFALYERGVRRQWVLSEYAGARVENDGRTLRIGGSVLSYVNENQVTAQVNERSALWGTPVEAKLDFDSAGQGTGPLELIEGRSHSWQPIAPRGHARVTLPQYTLDGAAYHDGNGGDVPLGTDCRGWDWVRIHTPLMTEVRYQPWGEQNGLRVVAHDAGVDVSRQPLERAATSRTRWGLRVPTTLGGLQAPRMLESSPFYARLESTSATTSAVGEVADFERFHRPTIRWMARMRTRLGEVA